MPGLDPGIHQSRYLFEMDCRVKPGNDNHRRYFAKNSMLRGQAISALALS